MRYLITTTDGKRPFLSNWFDANNHFETGMIVYDIRNYLYTTDGKTWQDLEADHL